MGGLTLGIYPKHYLVLEETKGDSLYDFSTLDVRILSAIKMVYHTDGTPSHEVVRSSTCLFDKRRKACYQNIPIVRYTHVSSTVSVFTGYNTLVSQLHRYYALITRRGNYVLEVAKLIKGMHDRGYRVSILFRKLKQHLRLRPYMFGDNSFHALFHAVKCCYTYLSHLPEGLWQQYDVEWDPNFSPPSIPDVVMYDVDRDVIMQDVI